MRKLIAGGIIAASAAGFGGQAVAATAGRVPVGKVHTVRVSMPCDQVPTRRGVYVRPCFDKGGWAINTDGHGTFVETDRPINRRIDTLHPLVIRWNDRFPSKAEVWHGRTLLADDTHIYR